MQCKLLQNLWPCSSEQSCQCIRSIFFGKSLSPINNRVRFVRPCPTNPRRCMHDVEVSLEVISCCCQIQVREPNWRRTYTTHTAPPEICKMAFWCRVADAMLSFYALLTGFIFDTDLVSLPFSRKKRVNHLGRGRSILTQWQPTLSMLKLLLWCAPQEAPLLPPLA